MPDSYKSPEASRAFATRQWHQAKRGAIECECERVVPIRFMYRCLYCGIWFCKECAEIHFGKTRDQYIKDLGVYPSGRDMTDEQTINDAALAAWAQYVASEPEQTFTPDDRRMFMVGFGVCLVAVTVTNENADA